MYRIIERIKYFLYSLGEFVKKVVCHKNFKRYAPLAIIAIIAIVTFVTCEAWQEPEPEPEPPVIEITPITIPTEAQAAATGAVCFAPSTQASKISLMLMRVVFLN